LIIDTHCHLDDARYDDLDEVYKRAFENSVKAFIIPGADIKTLKRAVHLCQTYKNTFFAVGVHPYDIDEYDRKYLEKYINHDKCIAVGECGLDYYRLPEDEEEKKIEKEKQKEIFIDQIELAKEYQKPLIVHIREASQDSLEILKTYADKSFGGVLHCYNASAILLELTEKNFYFGIGGVITFKNAKKLVDIVKDIPLDRIILETDAPYLTPHPFRGKRNEPAYTKYVLEKLSQLLLKPIDELEKQFYQNSLRLFKKVKLEV
jgi:TatD DNase family protein